MSSTAEDAYFATNPPPRNLESHISLAQSFIAAHVAAHRRVVLVTSGGTTVPLEKQTVRFIDNFSAGTRGATSAEYFLAAGYAVIFLHREFSLVPYVRHWSHTTTGGFLDFLELHDDDEEEGEVSVRPRADVRAKMTEVLKLYRRARDENLLLTIPFVTIGDYLHELRALSHLLSPLGPNALLYLAAAVSDFFVPPERMSEHKIQSTDMAAVAQAAATAAEGTSTPANGGAGAGAVVGEEEFDNFDAAPKIARSKRLVVDLDPVPKFLKNLVDGWAPQGMIASYKLETDSTILVHKARHSLSRYQHHLVIGNLLATRKWEVVFVSPGREDHWLRVARRKKQQSHHQKEKDGEKEGEEDGWGEEDVKRLRAGEVPKDEEPESEIEALIIPAVKELHDAHIEQTRNKQAA
jgi:phosphopantothenate-cysteine ligase